MNKVLPRLSKVFKCGLPSQVDAFTMKVAELAHGWCNPCCFFRESFPIPKWLNSFEWRYCAFNLCDLWGMCFQIKLSLYFISLFLKGVGVFLCGTKYGKEVVLPIMIILHTYINITLSIDVFFNWTFSFWGKNSKEKVTKFFLSFHIMQGIFLFIWWINKRETGPSNSYILANISWLSLR